MTNKSLIDDIDYLRTLAEAGETAPLLGGRFMAWWGAMIAIAYLGHYGVISGKLGFEAQVLGFWWMGIMTVALGGFFAMLAMMSKTKPGAGSAGNRVEAVIWKAAGFALFVLYGTLIAQGILTGRVDAAAFNGGLTTVFALYSVALAVSGEIAQNKPLKIASYVALATVGALILASGKAEIYLIAGIAAALTVFLPGLLLMRAEPSQTV